MARLLHLSDLHFRPGDPDDRDSAGRALVATVGAWAAAGQAPDVLIISGDLVEHGQAAAYPVAAAFLDRLRKAAGGLPPERVLCVPGNHDVDRARGRRLQRTLASPQDAALFFSDPAERELHRRKLAAYMAFVDGYLGPGAAERHRVELVVGPLRLGAALVWTPWFCQDDDDREKLWIDLAGLRQSSAALSGCDLRLALLHHGPAWLHPAQRGEAMAALAGFDLVCHGHLQALQPPGYEGTPLAGRLVLAAGSLHRRAQRPCRAFVIEVAPAALTVRPLGYRRGATRWETDPALAAQYGPEEAPRRFPLRHPAPPV